MQHSPNEVKEKLLRALDKDNNVVNMVAVIEVIAILEKIPITKDELEKTRLGKYVNELRKKTTNENLAKRAKDLVRKWRRLILPQDGTTLNGERNVGSLTGSTIVSPASISVSSHLPGPGPGHGSSSYGGGGFKPATTSPAAAALIANHHHHQQRAVKSGVVVVVSSPAANSQCSSTSTSPSVTSGRHGNGRPDTPSSSFSFSSSRLHSSSSNHIGFKPISPAAMGRMTNITVTPSSSSTRLNPPHPLPIPQSPAKSDVVRRSSPSFMGTTKRFRLSDNDDSCDSLGGKTRFRTANYQNNAISPCPIVATATTAMTVVNGIDGGNGDSMDSIHCRSSETGLEEETTNEPNVSKESSSGSRNPKKNSRSKKEKADVLKEKLASHGRTPKVKTTAELIQELKARNSGMVESVATGAGSNSRVNSLEMDHHLAVTRRAVYSSLLGTVEDVTRNKTQLMEKFLNDSMDGSDSTTNIRDGGESSSSLITDLYDPCTETVNAILRTLPPIDYDAIKWDDDEEEIVSSNPNPDDLDPSLAMTTKPEIDEETIRRLNDKSWEGVNGNYNQDEQFVRWNEPLTRRTYDDDLLHIWPYVDID